VSSVFLPEEDGVVRSWHLWDYVCQGGTATAIPSAQLAAAAFASESGDGRERLRRYLDFLAKSDKDASLEWPRNRDAKDALIPYLIGGSAKSQISDFLGSSGFRYERVRAKSLADDQVADAAFKDRIVVIGASYGPDKFATPFGTMPGAALIANAIAVAPAVLSSPPRHHLVVFLALLLALIYALIAKKFRAIIAAVIIAAFSWIWLSLATYWLNPSDAVNAVSMALITLGAFWALESAFEIVFDFMTGKRWSAFLRHTKELEVEHRKAV
jgi:CHASE2 domain-containing sensor protein